MPLGSINEQLLKFSVQNGCELFVFIMIIMFVTIADHRQTRDNLKKKINRNNEQLVRVCIISIICFITNRQKVLFWLLFYVYQHLLVIDAMMDINERERKSKREFSWWWLLISNEDQSLSRVSWNNKRFRKKMINHLQSSLNDLRAYDEWYVFFLKM